MKRFAIALLLVLSPCVRADVKLPAIFGDHMVLQRGMKVPMWGWADPGEKINVNVNEKTQSTTADEKGKWRIALDPIKSEQPITMTIGGKNSITLSDVEVGDVWLCSGQSNMERRVDQSANAEQTIAEAKQPLIRLFVVQHNFSDDPQEDVKGQWMVCAPETIPHFSAVAYFFGLELQRKLNVPIGLIESNWGGTRAEAWLPKQSFDRLNLPYEPQWTEEWLHPASNPASTRPTPSRAFEAPAVLYNGMIHPLAGFAMRGVIWYQGESNAPHPEKYRDVMSALITGWRQIWGEGDFPFLVVQLANFHVPRNTASVSNGNPGNGWPEVREAQAQLVNSLPNVGLACTIDIGESKDIHPKNKQDVGKRLALAAEKIAYGQDVTYSGPVIKSMQIDGNKAMLTFDHVDGGLMSKGDKLQGFEIAGEDGKFVEADAKIEGEKVVVSAEGVSAPKEVRYGWSDDPKCTLYNKAELPAVPFRTTGHAQ